MYFRWQSIQPNKLENNNNINVTQYKLSFEINDVLVFLIYNDLKLNSN